MTTILHIFSGDLWAGAEVVVFNLLKRLQDYPDLKILALSLNDGVLTSKLKDIGIETYIIPENKNHFIKIFWKALSILKGRRIDIIHSHRYKENLLALLLSKALRIKKIIATLHGLSEPPVSLLPTHLPLTHPSPLRGEGWVRGIKTGLDYYILRNYFSRIVAVSQDIKDILIQRHHFNREGVVLIYNGIAPPSTTQQLNNSTNSHLHIGTVGRMVPVKDLDLFLKVAAEIKKERKDVHFSILGDGPLRERLLQKAKALRIEDNIEFLPPRPDPFSYYHTLDIYLNTSIHEGIPLSILEAMASGKPVVAPEVGGIPEIISDKKEGFLVEGREPEKFADFCLKLIKNRDMKISMGKNASKKAASCFSSSKMAQSYRERYVE